MTEQATSLYAAWLQSIPEAFRGLVPTMNGGAPTVVDAKPDATTLPFPADQIASALNVLNDVLTRIYQGYLPLLAQGEITKQPIEAMASAVTAAFNGMLAFPNGKSMPWSLAGGLPTQLSGLIPGMSQLQVGMERAFGGLGEAFGLGPMRELEKAWREMLSATAAKQRAQVEYLALVAKAFSEGTTSLLQELQAMGARGESVDSLLAFMRLWVKAVDGPIHKAMQGKAGLEVTARVIRASSRHREQLQRVVGIASGALHVPTREQMNDAFREIQQLKRELRRLKRALPAATQKKLIQAKENAS